MLNLVFTEATEVQLTLFNGMHVQQVMSIVSQHPELTEVLKIQLHITEGQEPVGEPQQIDPVVQAAIKPVDKREASIPAPIPSERLFFSCLSCPGFKQPGGMLQIVSLSPVCCQA